MRHPCGLCKGGAFDVILEGAGNLEASRVRARTPDLKSVNDAAPENSSQRLRHPLIQFMRIKSKASAFKNEDWGARQFKIIQSPGHPSISRNKNQ
jgi:hypothetical protein